MAKVLDGKPVVNALLKRMHEKVEHLREKGVTPTLCLLRIGEKTQDVAYEKSILKQCEAGGVDVVRIILPKNATQEMLDKKLMEANVDDSIHGILLFRPFPEQIDDEHTRELLNPDKDVDGCTVGSLSGIFTNTKIGFAPCTPQAIMEILHFYRIDIERKRAAVIGRSLVVGRPISAMLMHENATVVTCHTRTDGVDSITREADILVSATGRLNSITAAYTNPHQVIIDVGINWDEERGKIAGDVSYEEVEPLVNAITPVPGGVGTVTTCVLVEHVIDAAERAATGEEKSI